MYISQTQLMLDAFHGGVKVYQPEYRGEALEQETGVPEVAVRNIKRLLKHGLIIDPHGIELNDENLALIRFTTGEAYLATGLDAGVKNRGSLALVQIAVLAKMGTERECLRFITHSYAQGASRRLALPENSTRAVHLHNPEKE